MEATKSKKYTLDKVDWIEILKVVGYTAASALISLLLAEMQNLELPEEWLFMGGVINVLLVAAKKFVTGKLN